MCVVSPEITPRQKRVWKEGSQPKRDWRGSSWAQMGLVSHTLILGLQVKLAWIMLQLCATPSLMHLHTLQLGYKVASRQLVYILSPCHAVTALQVSCFRI